MLYYAYQLSGRSRNRQFRVSTRVAGNFPMQGQSEDLENDTRQSTRSKSISAIAEDVCPHLACLCLVSLYIRHLRRVGSEV